MWIYVYTFCHKFGKMSQIRISRGSTQIITILHRGGHWNLLQYYKGGGGLPDLLQYYKGEGGVSRHPKFVLRNIWTAPYEVLRYYGRRGPKLLWRCSGQKLLWGRSIPQQHRRLGTRVPNHWAYCRGMRDLATQESISNCSSWDLIFCNASWEII